MEKKKERGQEVMLNFLLEYDFEAQLGVCFFLGLFWLGFHQNSSPEDIVIKLLV